MMEKQSASSRSPELQGHLAEILTSGREMDALTRRLLPLSTAAEWQTFADVDSEDRAFLRGWRQRGDRKTDKSVHRCGMADVSGC